MTTAVLLLGYGGPDSIDDIPAYLLDIRGGRETPQHLIDEIAERYRQIGGRSPLLDISRSLAAKLSEAIHLPVYVGMRHWRPWVKDAVAQMQADGVEQAVVICLAPHYSSLSIDPYRKRLDEALTAAGATFTVEFIENWHTQPDFIAGLAANLRLALQQFPAAASPQVIFTAHSLPEFILEQGDPYPDQLLETARLVAADVGLPDERWQFAYQSAGKVGVPWLGPDIDLLLPELAAAGQTDLLIAPVGFIMEHVEILYDIDIELQQIARQHGITLKRTAMLNDGAALVATLADLVGSNA